MLEGSYIIAKIDKSDIKVGPLFGLTAGDLKIYYCDNDKRTYLIHEDGSIMPLTDDLKPLAVSYYSENE